jgi:hypothetical protein
MIGCPGGKMVSVYAKYWTDFGTKNLAVYLQPNIWRWKQNQFPKRRLKHAPDNVRRNIWYKEPTIVADFYGIVYMVTITYINTCTQTAWQRSGAFAGA